MWQNKQYKLLRDEIEAILNTISDAASLYELVQDPLTQTRRGHFIANSTDRPWPLLPMIVCEAISSSYKNALPAAAALQLFKAAAEVFDDIEDADSSESLPAKHGIALATNAATILLILAERGITRLKRIGVTDDIIVRTMDIVNSYYTTACIGQHLDIYVNSKTSISEDTYLNIARMKTASQVECACYIGALLSDTNQETIDIFARFGYNLGMAVQITNDIQGITNGSDLIKRKITLPIIYALNQTEGDSSNTLGIMYDNQSKSIPDLALIKDILFHSGAIHYAIVKMELYKQYALDILSEVKRVGINTERLKWFLE